jgi:hypothetical protein
MMNAMMTSSFTLARPSFNTSATPGDNWTGRVSLAGAGAATTALAGAGLEFCASKTGAVWLHNTITAKTILDLQRIRLFIKI